MKKKNNVVSAPIVTTAATEKPVYVSPLWDNLSPVEQVQIADDLKKTALLKLETTRNELQMRISEIEKILGTPTTPAVKPPTESTATESTGDKILSSLKTGPKTVKELQQSTGTKWLNVALSKLIENKQIVSNGKKPALYSLKG